jgi:hypothetical protein
MWETGDFLIKGRSNSLSAVTVGLGQQKYGIEKN